jgi:hypothetical protein
MGLGRALHGRRKFAGSLGQREEFQPRDKKSWPPPDDPGNPTVDYRGEKRSNETHESKSDPEAQLVRKGAGKEAKLSYGGNLLVENRNGLIGVPNWTRKLVGRAVRQGSSQPERQNTKSSSAQFQPASCDSTSARLYSTCPREAHCSVGSM